MKKLRFYCIIRGDGSMVTDADDNRAFIYTKRESAEKTIQKFKSEDVAYDCYIVELDPLRYQPRDLDMEKLKA